MTFQPWRLPPLGAKRARSRMSASAASGRGSAVNSRAENVVRIASSRSMGVSYSAAPLMGGDGTIGPGSGTAATTAQRRADVHSRQPREEARHGRHTAQHRASRRGQRAPRFPEGRGGCGRRRQRKGVDRRGAGPMQPTLFGRGAGEGLGVHICTGPVAVKGAMPGDILEVRIIDVKPRPCANPQYKGKSFGSNAAAWWGFHYKELMTDPKPREVITIYEVDTSGDRNWAKALYNVQWTPQTDPYGVVHKIIDYPGVPVDHRTVRENHGILKNVRIPIRPHFGVLGLAPSEADIVDSIPPHCVGGNIDDWRIGKGATMYYPVAAPGALLSAGDSHASQGDSELCGTAVECSLTGTFQLVLHKKNTLSGSLAELDYPLLETQDEWVLHGFSFANYLEELGPNAQSVIYEK